MKGEISKERVMKEIIKMNLEADVEGFIYFNDLLFKSMQRYYGIAHIKNRILYKQELATVEKLEKIRDKMIKKGRQVDKINAIKVNPFLTMMYKNMSFNAWTTEYHKNYEKRVEQRLQSVERSSVVTGSERNEDDESSDESECELEEIHCSQALPGEGLELEAEDSPVNKSGPAGIRFEVQLPNSASHAQ